MPPGPGLSCGVGVAATELRGEWIAERSRQVGSALRARRGGLQTSGAAKFKAGEASRAAGGLASVHAELPLE